MYTYSTLVRMANRPADILTLLNDAINNDNNDNNNNDNNDNDDNDNDNDSDNDNSSSSNSSSSSSDISPLARCAIETLGKLGNPSLAVAVASQYLQGNASAFSSSDSGDSLMVALLANPTAKLDSSNSTSSSNSNSDSMIFETINDMTCEDASITLITGSNTTDRSIKCSTKGFCLLFSFLQRSMRSLPYSSSGTKRYCLIRDKLWAIARESIVKRMVMKREREGSLSSLTSNQTTSKQTISHRVKLNGRLCDAYIRYNNNIYYHS